MVRFRYIPNYFGMVSVYTIITKVDANLKMIYYILQTYKFKHILFKYKRYITLYKYICMPQFMPWKVMDDEVSLFAREKLLRYKKKWMLFAGNFTLIQEKWLLVSLFASGNTYIYLFRFIRLTIQFFGIYHKNRNSKRYENFIPYRNHKP